MNGAARSVRRRGVARGGCRERVPRRLGPDCSRTLRATVVRVVPRADAYASAIVSRTPTPSPGLGRDETLARTFIK